MGLKIKYTIIGGGIIGCALAKELLKQNRGVVTILEKETDTGLHASTRNSGVIHSGINHKPGTLKSKMCLKGSQLLREYCQSKEIPYRECGTLVVSQTNKQLKVIESLLKMGQEVGVQGLEIFDKKYLKKKEPLAIGENALFSPTGAVLDAKKLLKTLKSDILALGGSIQTNEYFQFLDGTTIKTNKGTFTADYTINCAGLHADVVAKKMGLNHSFKIFPFRGEYLSIDKKPIHSMIYQAPDLRFPFLNVHLTALIHGGSIAGPTANLSLGRENYDKNFNFSSMMEFLMSKRFYKMALSPSFFKMANYALRMSLSQNFFKKEVEKLIGPIEMSQIRPFRSGIRAQIVNEKGHLVQDLIVKQCSNQLHVLNCVSPGMTSALAFAKYLDKLIHNSQYF